MSADVSAVVSGRPAGVFRGVLLALAVCSLATLAVMPLRGTLLDANLALYYLLIVVWLTVKAGRSAGFAASVLSVLFFDIFLVPPYDSLTVHNPQHLLTFAMLLAVALVTSRLVDGLRTQTILAETREKWSESLRAMGDALLSAENGADVRRIGEQYVGGLFDAKVSILPPDLDAVDAVDCVNPVNPLNPVNPMDSGVLRLTVGMRKIAGAMLRRQPGAVQAPVSSAGVAYFPLQARGRIAGIMLVALSGRAARLDDTQERWLQTASVQLALALDRVHSIDLASRARLAEKNERFRNSILSSISHDIRTPLTTVVGLAGQLADQAGGNPARNLAGTLAGHLAGNRAGNGAGNVAETMAADVAENLAANVADTLAAPTPGVGGPDGDTAARLYRAALRMDATVTNLLDIARFSQHGVAINADWAAIDEIIGSAILGRPPEGAQLAFESEIRGTPALVKFDALLVEKVLCNLIDNAVRHARGATRIVIRARFGGGWLRVSVLDDGCGIAHGLAVANVLAQDGGRDDRPRDHGGLGLSICRAICEAHGGRLRIFGRPGKGCCAMLSIPVTESLPLDSPESLDYED